MYDVAGNRLLHSTPNDTGARPGYLFDLEGSFYVQGDGFDVPAHDFPGVVVHARSGDDVASLTDSVLKDELHMKGHKTEIFDLVTKGDVYKITARKFDRVRAEASEGGFDKAKLWDTTFDDLVEASGDQVTFSSLQGELETIYEVLAFEWVRARSFYGENNTSKLTEPLTIDFTLEWAWDQ